MRLRNCLQGRNQGYGSGGAFIFTARFSPLVQVTLYLLDEEIVQAIFFAQRGLPFRCGSLSQNYYSTNDQDCKDQRGHSREFPRVTPNETSK